jgi:hypothetical protein
MKVWARSNVSVEDLDRVRVIVIQDAKLKREHCTTLEGYDDIGGDASKAVSVDFPAH